MGSASAHPTDAAGAPRKPFSHPDWLFEIKHDGFRALAYIERREASAVTQWELVQELSCALRESRIGIESEQCPAGR